MRVILGEYEGGQVCAICETNVNNDERQQNEKREEEEEEVENASFTCTVRASDGRTAWSASGRPDTIVLD